MEYKIYHKIRKYNIPLFIRIIIMVFLIVVGLLFVAIPIPGSSIPGWWIITLSFIFVLEAKNLRFIKKIRKGLFYFIKNIKCKKTRKHKIKDIKKHIKQIIKNKK